LMAQLLSQFESLTYLDQTLSVVNRLVEGPFGVLDYS